MRRKNHTPLESESFLTHHDLESLAGHPDLKAYYDHIDHIDHLRRVVKCLSDDLYDRQARMRDDDCGGDFDEDSGCPWAQPRREIEDRELSIEGRERQAVELLANLSVSDKAMVDAYNEAADEAAEDERQDARTRWHEDGCPCDD